MKTLDAVVIGAGHAGLAVSYRLARAGIEHVVLERGEVGNTWRTQRWDSFQLNTPNQRSRLPGSRDLWTDAEGFMTTAEWIRALDEYARMHTLPVRTHCSVAAVEREPGGTFRIALGTGERIDARAVIAATGDQNVARRPAAMRDLAGTVETMTAAEYRRPDQLAPGAVLVVGSGQSGVQITEDLLEAGREVYLAAGKCGRVPRRLRGRDTLVWLEEAGWFDQRPQDLADPTMVRAAQPQISGKGQRGHSVSLQWLAGRGVTLLGHLETVEGARLRFADDLPARIRFADEISASLRKDVDDHISKSGKAAPPTDPDLADEPAADAESYRGPTELDLRDRGIASAIFTTGFGGDFSYLKPVTLDDRGRPVHAAGRSPIDGIWVIGLVWMRVRRSGIIPGADADSALLADQVSRYFAGERPAA